MSEALVTREGRVVGPVDVEDATMRLYWRTREGELIAVRDMTDQHLRNTALMLMGMGYQFYRAPDGLKVAWLTALRIEWERRMRERGKSEANLREVSKVLPSEA